MKISLLLKEMNESFIDESISGITSDTLNTYKSIIQLVKQQKEIKKQIDNAYDKFKRMNLGDEKQRGPLRKEIEKLEEKHSDIIQKRIDTFASFAEKEKKVVKAYRDSKEKNKDTPEYHKFNKELNILKKELEKIKKK